MPGEGWIYWYMYWPFAFGGSLYDKAKDTVTLNGQKNVKAYEWIGELWKKYDYQRQDGLGFLSEKADIISVGSGHAAIDGLEGLLLPLDPYLAKWSGSRRIYDRLWDTMRSQGKTYGIPITSDTRGIILNGVILFKAGIDVGDAPLTWDKMAEIAKKTTILDSGKRKVLQAGYTTTWGFCIHQDFQLLLASAGGMVVDKNMQKPVFNASAGFEAVELMKKLYESSFPSGYGSLPASDAELFAQGKAAMARGLTWHMSLASKSPALAKRLILRPVARSQGSTPVVMAYVNGFSIPRSAKEPQLALAFIQSLATPRNLLKINEFIGGCSPSQDSMPLAKAGDSPLWPFYEHLPKAVPAPTFPEIPETYPNLDNALMRALSGKADIRQALDQSAALWKKGLDRWWSVGLRKKALATIGK